MDNMAGISVLCGLARYLQDAREREGFRPRQTEVVLLAMSAEEAGLRGAKRYAARHKDELFSLPTYAIFLDGIYDEKYLTAFRRELWCGAKMDPYLVDLAQEAARENGYPMKVTACPWEPPMPALLPERVSLVFPYAARTLPAWCPITTPAWIPLSESGRSPWP
jgi:Zn-dependent M28 family amino/carboxypeptidase